MTIDNRNDLGKLLKQRRVMVPLTLQELARASGVSASHLGRIERGERFPSAHILPKIAKPLGFAEDDLFTFAGYLSPRSPSTAENKTQLGRVDPNVARALAQEPVEVQRATLAIFSALKYIAKGIAQENSQRDKENGGQKPRHTG